MLLSTVSCLWGEQIKTADQVLKLTDFIYLESERSPGSYLIPDGRFQPYDGGNLVYADNQSKRMFTFHASFGLSAQLKNVKLSLMVGPADYPMDIYLNGLLILKRGSYGDIYISALHTSRVAYLPEGLLKYDSRENSLIVQVFPDSETMPLPDLYIAEYHTAEGMGFWRNFVSVNMVQVAVFFAFLIGAYILSLYLTGSRYTYYVYFSLLCLAFMFGYCNLVFSYNQRPEVLLEKFSRSGIIMSAAMLAVFILEYTHRIRRTLIIKAVIIGTAVITGILIYLQPNKAGIGSIFNAMLSFYIGPVLLFSLALSIITVILNPTRKSIVITIGMTAIIAASVHDLVYNVNSRVPYTWLVSHGFIVLIMCIAIVLVIEQHETNQAGKRQAADLNRSLQSIEKMVGDITMVSDDLVETGGKLDRTVQTSVQVVEEYQNSNSSIKDIILREFTSLDDVIGKFREHVANSIEKIPHAITNQIAVVEEISATIGNMKTNIDHTSTAMEETRKMSSELAALADDSRQTMHTSGSVISSLQEYTTFINEVMSTIEDITARTNLLSINAAIEAARAGKAGAGFSVLAGEIRNLSSRSRESLETSFDKLQEMEDLIGEASNHSQNVESSLEKIMTMTNESSQKIAEVTDQIIRQQQEQEAILLAVDSLLNDSLTIKELTDRDAEETTKNSETLDILRKSFQTITETLKTQENRSRALTEEIEKLTAVLDTNRKNIEILKDSIREG